MQFAIYRFHIALQHITPRIWRRVELRAEYSLADLQRVIQIGMDWSDEYQHRFTIRNHFLGTARVGGLLLLGNPAEMKLWQFEFRLHERFRYDYNFFDGWTFDIRFEGQDVLDPNRVYPRCIAGAHRAPPEDCGGAEFFMDHHVTQPAKARKAYQLHRTLRRLGQLLEDPTLDDHTLRSRSRLILRDRPPLEFDRRALNAALAAAFRAPCNPTQESSDGDKHPGDHR